MQVEILNKKEIQKIENILKKNYSSELNLKEYLVLKNEIDEIWISSKEIANIDITNLNVNSTGLYFGKLKDGDKISLSIEGCQLIGRTAKRNIAEIDDENLVRFMEGFDVKPKEKIDCEENNFVLIKYQDDFVGTGILRKNIIENKLPKSRRIFIQTFKQ